jgi:hypothetical protein
MGKKLSCIEAILLLQGVASFKHCMLLKFFLQVLINQTYF